MGKAKSRPQPKKVQMKKKKKSWKRIGSKGRNLVEKSNLNDNPVKQKKLKSISPGPQQVSTPSLTPGKLSLRERMMKRLEAARFRQVNEELDSGGVGTDPKTVFESSISNFQSYHKAYRERVEAWPENPLDLMIDYVNKKVPKTHVIADFGCGEAKLSESVPHTTHSFDLFALNNRVTACDMTSTPLRDQSVDVAIFCLSLMGTQVGKYIVEANRVLKQKGILRIAEVASRFPQNNASNFIKRMKKFGFVSNDRVKEGGKGNKSGSTGSTDQVFLLLEFLKVRAVRTVKGKLPSISLTPCNYKKR